MNIYIDHRELKVIDTIKNEFEKPLTFGEASIDVIVKTLDIGDYMITVDTSETTEQVLAIIERKTLKDYGSSLKDGRCQNIDKLIKLRDETGCKIYYIIEGSSSPNFDTEYCGIAYSSILANITDIGIVHNITAIHTKNGAETGQRLKFLCERYHKLYPTIKDGLRGAGEINQIVEKCKPTAEEELKTQVLVMWHNLMSDTDKVNTKPPSTTRALALASRWTIREFLERRVPIEEVEAIRINGNRLPNKVVNKFSGQVTLRDQKKILVSVKGITDGTADILLARGSILATLGDITSRDIVINPGKGTKLGNAKFEKLRKLFMLKV